MSGKSHTVRPGELVVIAEKNASITIDDFERGFLLIDAGEPTIIPESMRAQVERSSRVSVVAEAMGVLPRELRPEHSHKVYEHLHGHSPPPSSRQREEHLSTKYGVPQNVAPAALRLIDEGGYAEREAAELMLRAYKTAIANHEARGEPWNQKASELIEQTRKEQHGTRTDSA